MYVLSFTGPGRLFNQLRLRAPPDTHPRRCCCVADTQSNARFAVTVDPNNQALAARKAAIDEARSKVGVFVCVWVFGCRAWWCCAAPEAVSLLLCLGWCVCCC
jgi:hypothetical protein